MARTLTLAERNVMAGRVAQHYLLVQIRNPANLDWVEVGGLSTGNYRDSVAIAREQDTPTASCVVTLNGGKGAASIHPGMTTATQNVGGRLVDVARAFRVFLAVMPLGVAAGAFPASPDWKLIHHGMIDTIDDTRGEVVSFTGRDLMVPILDAVFGTTRTYGTAQGVAVETVLQSMLSDVLGGAAPVITTPVSPAWLITASPMYTVKVGTGLYAAMKQLADQIGWRLWYGVTGTTPTLFFTGPTRVPVAADWTIAASEVHDIASNRFSLEPVRNSVLVQFRDVANVPSTATATNAGSITAYGTRPMVVIEAKSSQLRTALQAQRMADAIVSDLALPLLTQTIVHQHAMWSVEPTDVLDVAANGVHFDAQQRLAVTSTRLEIGRDALCKATWTVRGSPASRGRGWLDLSGPTLSEQSIVTPTLVYTPTSYPTNGGSAALHIEGVVTGLNPNGGALPIIAISYDPTVLTLQQWNGTSWVALTNGATITSGTSIRAHRPAAGSTFNAAIVLTATLDLAVDRITFPIAAQDYAIAPVVKVELLASNATTKQYRISTITGGALVAWIGGGAKTIGNNAGVFAAEPQDYTFTRPLATLPDAEATFHAARGGVIDADFATIPAIGRDTVPILTRLTSVETANNVTVRVSASTLFANQAATITLVDTFGLSIVDVATGATCTNGESRFVTITQLDGDVSAAAYYRDYVITRPAATANPARIVFRVNVVAAGFTPDADSIDVSPTLLITPSIVCRPFATTTQYNIQVTTQPAGGTVRLHANAGATLLGLSPAIGVDAVDGTTWSIQRPAALTADVEVTFRGLLNGVFDFDSVVIPAVERDTVPILTRLTSSESTGSVAVRVTASTLFADPAATITLIDTFTLNVIDVATGAVCGNGDVRALTISQSDGYVGAVAYYRDYTITRPAIGKPPARLVFRVSVNGGGYTPDSDSIDVQPIVALTPGRHAIQSLSQSGADITLAWRSLYASGAEATLVPAVALTTVRTPAGGGGIVAVGQTVVRDVGNGWFAVTFTRVAGDSQYAALFLFEDALNGTARTELTYPIPTYTATASAGPRFGSVTVNVPPAFGTMTCSFSPIDAPAGALYNAVVTMEGVITSAPVGVSSGLSLIVSGQANFGGFYTQPRKASVRITMTDSGGNEIVSRVSANTTYYEPP